MIIIKKRGKLIVVEGTDCSGKETQVTKLIERLQLENISYFKYYYPHYEDPTGKIIGGPYLGKEHICEGYFPEGAASVDPKVATLYYGADFKYTAPLIEKELAEGKNVFLDRYYFSSLAHQGGKEQNKTKRFMTYKWMDNLFNRFLELPKVDLVILLYMPHKYAAKLKVNRLELDQHETNDQHLKDAERSYLEIADIYDFKIINCVKNNEIRTIDNIHEEVYQIVKETI